jgi:hypothetical protein
METEDKKKNQLPLGTWDKLEATEQNKEKIKFEINIPRTVVFMNNVPQEHTGEDGGVYYTFEVQEGAVDKIINTSAWSLLRGIKGLSLDGNFIGIAVKITKVMVKKKQQFIVEKV